MTKWALGFASVGDTYIVRFDDGRVFTLAAPTKGKQRKKTPLEQVPDQVREPVVEVFDERVRFIDEELQAGDEIWCEMGGPAGPLLYRAFVKGIHVFRVPVVDIPGVDDNVEEDDVEEGIDEPPKDVEELEAWEARENARIDAMSAEELAEFNAAQDAIANAFQIKRDEQRRDRALAVMELAKTSPEKFYAMRLADAAIAAVSVMTRNFANWQKNRIKMQSQLMQINRDLGFYPDQSSKALARMRRSFGEEDLLKETVVVEDRMERFIANSLDGIDLYNLVFEPINGCGVITSARIIDVIQDIRRFPSGGQFRRYTGWFPVGPSGQIERRRRGVICRYSPKLKQAGNLFGMQVAQYGRGEEFRTLYETTLELEKGRVPAGHAARRARRKVIGAFLDRIFREWWRYEVTAGTMDTVQVPLEDIPPGVAQSLSYWYPDLGAQMQRKAA